MEDDAGYESGAGSAAEDGAGPACGEEAMDAEEREDDSPRTQLIKANIRVVGPAWGASGRGPEAGWDLAGARGGGSYAAAAADRTHWPHSWRGARPLDIALFGPCKHLATA